MQVTTTKKTTTNEDVDNADMIYGSSPVGIVTRPLCSAP